MNLSRLFILKPIATSLLMVAIVFSGIVAYQLLPVSSLPEVEYPTIQVFTFYPGASPYVTASAITAPLEKQFGQMSGLNQMTSTSSNGASIITLQFTLDTALDVGEQEVQAAINAASNYLPTDLPNPPVYSKVNPADTPIMTLALTSKTLPLFEVEDFADTRLAQRVSESPGVGLVSISGGQRPAVRIQANPNALSAYGLTLENLRTVITQSNINAAKGNFDGPRLSYTIDSNDQLLTSKDYKPLVIAYKNDAPIRLADVANVIDDAEDVKQAAWMNHTPAVIVNIQRQPGANVIAVVDRIKKLLTRLQSTIPSAINLKILTDRTDTIRASVKDVQFELMLSVALVVMVIFLFLRNFAATIIPSVSVPVSLVGTLGAMYLMGFSLNNLTLMALTIATGFVVDDAIVMIENISRYIEEGMEPIEAALKGSKQIGFTILSLTASLIAVLIPLLFMKDVIGLLFKEFAITVSVTVLISAFVSLTLTPMMCARLLHHHDPKETPDSKRPNQTLDYIIEKYSISLKWVLAHQKLVLNIAVVTLFVTCFLFYLVPKGFFPMQDTGLIQGISEASQSISFKAMSEKQQSLADVILKDPDVESLSSFIGIDKTNTSLNSGRVLISLKPLEDRDDKAIDIARRLQTKLADIPGITLYMQPVQNLTIDDRISRAQYQYSIEAANEDDVTKWTELFINKLQKNALFKDVASDQQNLGLQTHVNIDRDTAARLGITTQLIDDTLYDAFGQRQISIIFTQRNQYRVVLEALPQLQQDANQLSNIYLTSSAGESIPLNTFTELNQSIGPLVIHRQNQFPVATISFNLAEGASLSDAMSEINKIKNELNVPENIQAQFEGVAKIFQSSLANEGWLFLAAIIVVYIVLGVLYESYIHPITILSTLPSACVGALLALMFVGSELDIIALIGIILLIGIVMKNAIMMIDFALEQEREFKKPAIDAIYQAALLRFRPILMTTMASLFGAVPLAFGSGIGSELRRPLGIVIIGGLIFSQLLTLYTTPVIYLAFDKLLQHLSKKFTWINLAAPSGSEE